MRLYSCIMQHIGHRPECDDSIELSIYQLVTLSGTGLALFGRHESAGSCHSRKPLGRPDEPPDYSARWRAFVGFIPRGANAGSGCGGGVAVAPPPPRSITPLHRDGGHG